jgi:hypothetical protein
MVRGCAGGQERLTLEAQARAFASDISHLLNNTVTSGVRISAVLNRDTGDCWVGRNLTRTNLAPAPVSLSLGRKAPRAYLFVAHILQLDPEGRHLMNTQATFGVYLDEDLEEMAVHYDYIRTPSNPYPEAHLQLSGDSPAFTRLGERAGLESTLGRLHFPVGGRRYRPSLEDLVEFLVVEGFVEAHEGWEDVVRFHRDKFHELQLKAAVRRNPGAAREALEDVDDEEQ